jgi:predicted patatin/cPLA2 family phospholipase
MLKRFTILGLGGGGMKGILQVGALTELAKHQPLEFPDGVYGCSVGAIIGTYVAFGLPIDKMIPLSKKYLTQKAILPSVGLYDISTCLSSKGLFSMSTFEATIIKMFEEAGLDVRDKNIGDAKMPLFIVTSNVTKGKPAILSKNVSVIEALKCSCCVPGVFKPQMLYGQVYVDGGLFSPNIRGIVPLTPTTLIIVLPRPKTLEITATTLSSISSIDFAFELISIATKQGVSNKCNECTLSLVHPNVTSTTDIMTVDIDSILKFTSSKLRRFLSTKNFYDEII